MHRIAFAAACALLWCAGCGLQDRAWPVPSATGELELPPGVSRSRMLACAQDGIEALGRDDSHWLPVELRDPAAGVLESRDFAPANVIGYRVRITAPDPDRPARIVLKAAGPHFTDLGADRALADLEASIRRCLSGD